VIADTLLDSFPTSRYDASVAEVLNEIRTFQGLEADWDSEEAFPMSSEAIRLACLIVQMVAREARNQRVSWQPPGVGPNPDGGIDLEWEGGSRRVLMIIRPVEPPSVECIVEEVGSQPRREMLSAWDAFDRALWAIGDD
jgi:hypothetical protein